MRRSLNYQVALFCLILCTPCLSAQEATQPSIMIIPAKSLMNRLGHIEEVTIDGRTRYVQNYEKLFLEEPELRFAISQIQERFADIGMPVKDLENALQRINIEEALDAAENIELSIKDLILKQARPDVLLELDYFNSGSGLSQTLVFNVRMVDAYTDLAFATASYPGLSSVRNNLAVTLAEQVEQNINNLQSAMQLHFDDLRANGRIITVRINLESGAPINDFRRERCSDKPYTHFIRDIIKRKAVNGSHRLVSNGAKEIKYDAVRIPLYDDEGYPMGAAEWAYQLAEQLSNDCDIIAIDITAKLGEAQVLIIP